MLAMQPPETVNIFYCYAHEDKSWQIKLQKHLSNLRWQKLINDYHSRDILAGQDWQQTIDTYLDKAHIIILLISSDFTSSDYYYGIEMMRAMKRHKSGEACVIPILLRPVDVSGAPFSRLQMLPADQRSVKEWGNTDKAFEHITLELRKVIFDILGKPDYVDELLEQPAVLLNPSRTSRATRASTPSSSNTRTKKGMSKQNPAQVLADTADARIFKRAFPKTNKRPILEDVKELLTAIEFSDFIRLNPKKFKRYRRGRIRSSGWFFFFAFDVALASWGMYNWTHSSYVAIATLIILLIFFLWNSINESTFAGVILTLLFTGIWCGLGALCFQYVPSIHIQFIVVILVSLLFSYLRFELFKPTR